MSLDAKYGDRLKAEMLEFPPLPSEVAPPMFRAGPGAFPSELAKLLLEIVERLDRLEARLSLAEEDDSAASGAE